MECVDKILKCFSNNISNNAPLLGFQLLKSKSFSCPLFWFLESRGFEWKLWGEGVKEIKWGQGRVVRNNVSAQITSSQDPAQLSIYPTEWLNCIKMNWTKFFWIETTLMRRWKWKPLFLTWHTYLSFPL